ncbi:DUF2059 domain-containing protein [Algibacter sp. 2305UL17-15]|uniref:DUF2059 domain-containing protein n=1 Tax=Algibacter sp. 2305UL17-15 TaxID=3231268 RepID=UPI0034591BED
MKNLVLAFVLLSAISIQAQDTSEFKTETIEFIQLTGATKAFDEAINQIGAMVSEENKEAYTKEAKATLTGLYAKMSELYMAEFTRDEIQELVKFYKTDLGKKLAGKQLSLAQKGMMMGQSWGMEVQGIAQKYN